MIPRASPRGRRPTIDTSSRVERSSAKTTYEAAPSRFVLDSPRAAKSGHLVQQKIQGFRSVCKIVRRDEVRDVLHLPSSARKRETKEGLVRGCACGRSSRCFCSLLLNPPDAAISWTRRDCRIDPWQQGDVALPCGRRIGAKSLSFVRWQLIMDNGVAAGWQLERRNNPCCTSRVVSIPFNSRLSLPVWESISSERGRIGSRPRRGILRFQLPSPR